MKKFLPKSSRNPQGFTLIELLIVVTIIAVLSAIGYAVYANLGLQPKARNNRRRADIDAISKALEVNKVPEGNYVVLAGGQFSNGTIPSDPGTTNVYCGTSTLADVTGANPTSAWTLACTGITATWGTVSATVPAAAAQWKVCAWLEAEVNPTVVATAYCRRSSQ